LVTAHVYFEHGEASKYGVGRVRSLDERYRSISARDPTRDPTRDVRIW